LLIVTGLYRSGTTLVQKTLDSIREVNLINHGIYSFFKVLDGKYSSADFVEKDRLLGINNYTGSEGYGELLQVAVFDVHDVANVLSGIEDEILSDTETGSLSHPNLDWLEVLKKTIQPGKASEIFKHIVEAISDYRKEKNREAVVYSGFKELNLEQFIVPLLKVYGDDVKILQIIRDPRAVLASRNFSNKDYHKRFGEKNHPLYLITQMWRTSIFYKYYLLKKYPGQFLSITYEDFVVNFEKTMTTVLQFLELEIQALSIDPSTFKDERGNPWRQNTSHVQNTGISQASLKKWEEILPNSVLGALEYMCNFEMIQSGCQPKLSIQEQYNQFVAYTEDKNKLKSWAKEFGLILTEEKKQKEITRTQVLNECYS
jgi:hypothetical protein